jgi:hypothetical protein
LVVWTAKLPPSSLPWNAISVPHSYVLLNASFRRLDGYNGFAGTYMGECRAPSRDF